MADTSIRCEIEGALATITLDGPARLNAVTDRTLVEFVDALDRVDGDDGVRAVIVTGEGRAFCAGTDISAGFDLPTGGNPATGEGIAADVGAKVALRLFRMKKPVIGAINGAAVGFGASVTLPMDIRLGSTACRFGYVFTRRGIIAESCSSWFLPRIVGIATAQEWMITGRMVDAAEAMSRGLLHEIVEPDRLIERARRIAADIAENTAPVSVALTRQLLWRMLGASHPAIAHRYESRGLAAALSLPDAAEAVSAHKARRQPEFEASVSGNDFPPSWWPDDSVAM